MEPRVEALIFANKTTEEKRTSHWNADRKDKFYIKTRSRKIKQKRHKSQWNADIQCIALGHVNQMQRQTLNCGSSMECQASQHMFPRREKE